MTDEYSGDTQAEADDAGTEANAQTQPRGWLQNLFRRKSASNQYARRLQDLDDAIALHPDSVVNYVLRGELCLELGQYDLAASDFARACELAAAQVETNNWGIVAQAMYDRAQVGLRKVGRHAPYPPERQPNRLLDEDVAENKYGQVTTSED